VHLNSLVKEILDLAGIESGKLSLALESVSLAEVLSECQDMTEPQAQLRSIEVTFPLLDKPMFVWADRTRFKQILVNLLSNATKYNRERGSVRVEATAVTAKRTRISVTDTGLGLTPEKLAQLLEPFNRLGQESGFVAGTGIGLVVARQLAMRMGGILGVESTVGLGTVFWVELLSTATPEAAVDATEPPGDARSPAPTGPRVRTLLYVEDNPSNFQLVAQLIARRADLRLLTAVNGTLGIDLARLAQPDVILMDLKLPGISGTEALKILREDPVAAHIPVVAVTAYARPEDIANGMEAGFASYLTKPIKVKEFMDTLDVALEFSEREKRSGS
jgi:CheY-like chemotaxis protein/two-component sensor histidine kinase